MEKKLSVNTSLKKTKYFSVSCLLISLVLILLSKYVYGFAQWYAVNIYPVFPNYIGRFFSVWNFSFFEISILLILTTAVIMVFTGILLVFLRAPSAKSYRLFCTSIFCCAAAGLMLVYSLTGAINYQRDSIGTVLKLPQESHSKENLKKLSLLLAEDLTTLTDDPGWDYSSLTLKDKAYIESVAIDAMKRLGEKEPSLAGYYPKAKPAYFSRFLSALGIEGIFSPFTIEANYNQDMTPFLIPYTISHELAHLKGYMKEDDAGFIAYLASKNSPSKVFQYSGLFHVLIFTLNDLKSEAGTEEFNEVYQKLPEPVRLQLGYIKEQNMQNASPMTSVTESVNDLYLKANSQSGTVSYGRIVDLLLGEYADRINRENLI